MKQILEILLYQSLTEEESERETQHTKNYLCGRPGGCEGSKGRVCILTLAMVWKWPGEERTEGRVKSENIS